MDELKVKLYNHMLNYGCILIEKQTEETITLILNKQ